VRRAVASAIVAAVAIAAPALAKGGGGGQTPPVSAASAEAAMAGDIRISFDWAMTVDCTGPTVGFPITYWPAGLNGTLVLDQSRSYSIVLNFGGLGMPGWTLRWEGQLGRAPALTRGGSAELRVAGQHTLKAILHEPNNDVVFNVDADENGCRLTVEPQLHPDKTIYTLYNGDARDDFRFENCSAVRTVAATCHAQ